MPANVVKSVSKKCEMSLDEAEKKWNEAKEAAADEDHKEDYDYIMSIFKRMIGKECMKKMGWANENIVDKIDSYLNEKKYKWEDMRDWVFDKLENSDMDVEELEAAFLKKFGKSNKKYMEKAMSEFMD